MRKILFIFVTLLFVSNLFAANRVINLVVGYKTVYYAGKPRKAIAVNNQIPAPTLHFREGEHVSINVYNRLNEETAIHWHGVLVPWQMDGVLGISQQGIQPGSVFHYEFTLHQAGTYWYHAHAGLQEQEGLYGAFLIDPPQPPIYNYTKDYVVVLSDWSNTEANQILANLKKEGDYYSPRFPLQPSLAKFIHDYRKASVDERKKLIDDYKMMQQMRMGIYDISDVAYDAFLLNGQPKCNPWTAHVKIGDVVRLRFIGAGGSTIFHVKIPGTTMQMVHVQGNDVNPYEIEDFTIAPGETYDVLVKIQKNDPYIIYAESIDTVGAAYGALISEPHQFVNYQNVAPFPEPLPVTREMMSMMMGSMDHSSSSMNMSMHSSMNKETKQPHSMSSMSHDMKKQHPKKMNMNASSHSMPMKMNKKQSQPMTETMSHEMMGHPTGDSSNNPPASNTTKMDSSMQMDENMPMNHAMPMHSQQPLNNPTTDKKTETVTPASESAPPHSMQMKEPNSQPMTGSMNHEMMGHDTGNSSNNPPASDTTKMDSSMQMDENMPMNHEMPINNQQPLNHPTDKKTETVTPVSESAPPHSTQMKETNSQPMTGSMSHEMMGHDTGNSSNNTATSNTMKMNSGMKMDENMPMDHSAHVNNQQQFSTPTTDKKPQSATAMNEITPSHSMEMKQTISHQMDSMPKELMGNMPTHSDHSMMSYKMKMRNDMKIDHSMSMNHANHMNMPTEPTIIGDTISPPDTTYKTSQGTKYQNMVGAVKTNDSNMPITGVINMELFGYMERFIWFINGVPEYNAKPIRLDPGKRYRIVFTNTSMMHHPMHIHGHWFILRKGNGSYDPLLHTIDIPPGATVTADIDTDASGQWFFHCHLLYHMMTGMSRVFQYSSLIEITKGEAKPQNIVKDTTYHNRPIVRVDEIRPIDLHLVKHPMAHPAGFWFASLLDIGEDPFHNVQKLTYKGMYGPDYDKLELLIEDAEVNKGKIDDADIDIFYWRLINQFWAVKGGANYFYRPAKKPYWQPGIGIEGLMPYFIETDIRGYYHSGSAKIDIELSRDTQITNNFLIRLGIRSILATKTVPDDEIGSGLNQMRFIIRPYYRLMPGLNIFVEYEHEQNYGAFKTLQSNDGEPASQNTLTLGLGLLF